MAKGKNKNGGAKAVKALFDAIEKNDLKRVQKLIAAKVNVNAKNENGKTPLYLACFKPDAEIAEALIKANANINEPDRGNQVTPLMVASQEGNLKILEALIAKGVDVTSKDGMGFTALYYAAFAEDHDNAEIAEALIEAGADVNAKSNSGSAPLFFAAQDNKPNILGMLIERGAVVDHQGYAKQSALSISSSKGHVEIVEKLIAAHATVDVIQKNGHTPLSLAAISAHEDIAEILLAAGADIDFNDDIRDRLLPSRYALIKERKGIAILLLETRAKKAGTTALDLVFSGAVEKDAFTKKTLSEIALTKSTTKFAQELSEAAPKATKTDDLDAIFGNITGLMEEISNVTKKYNLDTTLAGELRTTVINTLQKEINGGVFEVLEKGKKESIAKNLREGLEKLGVDVEALITRAKDAAAVAASSSLLDAVKAGNLGEVERLIELGVDVNALSDGITPLDQAILLKNEGMVDLLLSRGANINATQNSKPLIIAAQNPSLHIVKALLKAGADPTASSIVTDRNQNITTALLLFTLKLTSGKEIPDIKEIHDEIIRSFREKAEKKIRNAKAIYHKTVESLKEKAGQVVSQESFTGPQLAFAEVFLIQQEFQVTIDGLKKQIINASKTLGKDTADIDRLLELGLSRSPVEEIGKLRNWLNRETSALSELMKEGAGKATVTAKSGAAAKVEAKADAGLLFRAVDTGNLEEVTRLITAGVDVNTTGTRGGTSLHTAAELGHEAILTKLIEARANVNAQANENSTALHSASFAGKEKAVAILLDDQKINVNLRNNSGDTALHYASSEGHARIVEMLIAKEAEVDSKNKNGGLTPLHAAAAQGHERVIEILLGAGADINTAKGGEVTPVRLAFKGGHEGAVNLLLEKKAEKEKCTPLDLVLSGKVETLPFAIKELSKVVLKKSTAKLAQELSRAALTATQTSDLDESFRNIAELMGQIEELAKKSALDATLVEELKNTVKDTLQEKINGGIFEVLTREQEDGTVDPEKNAIADHLRAKLKDIGVNVDTLTNKKEVRNASITDKLFEALGKFASAIQEKVNSTPEQNSPASAPEPTLVVTEQSAPESPPIETEQNASASTSPAENKPEPGSSPDTVIQDAETSPGESDPTPDPTPEPTPVETEQSAPAPTPDPAPTSAPAPSSAPAAPEHQGESESDDGMPSLADPIVTQTEEDSTFAQIKRLRSQMTTVENDPSTDPGTKAAILDTLKSNIQELEEQHPEALKKEREVQDLEGQVEELQAEVAHLKSSDIGGDTKALYEELQNIANERRALEDEVKALKTQIKELTTANEGLKEQVENNQAEITAKDDEVASLTKKNTELVKAQKTLNAKNLALSGNLKNSQNRSDTEKAELQKQIQELNEQINTQQNTKPPAPKEDPKKDTTIRNLEGQLEAMATENAALRAEIESKSSELKSAATQKEKEKAEAAKSHAVKIEQLKAQITALTSSVQKGERAFSALQEKLQSTSGELQALKSSKSKGSKNSQTIEDLKKQLRESAAEKQKLSAKLNGAKATSEQAVVLTGKVSQLESEKKGLAAELEAATQNLERRESAISEYLEQERAGKRQYDVKMAEMLKKDEQVRAAIAEINEQAGAAIAERDAIIIQLQEQIVALQSAQQGDTRLISQKNALEKEVTILKARYLKGTKRKNSEIETLKGGNRDLQAQIDTLTAQLEKVNREQPAAAASNLPEPEVGSVAEIWKKTAEKAIEQKNADAEIARNALQKIRSKRDAVKKEKKEVQQERDAAIAREQQAQVDLAAMQTKLNDMQAQIDEQEELRQAQQAFAIVTKSTALDSIYNDSSDEEEQGGQKETLSLKEENERLQKELREAKEKMDYNEKYNRYFNSYVPAIFTNNDHQQYLPPLYFPNLLVKDEETNKYYPLESQLEHNIHNYKTEHLPYLEVPEDWQDQKNIACYQSANDGKYYYLPSSFNFNCQLYVHNARTGLYNTVAEYYTELTQAAQEQQLASAEAQEQQIDSAEAQKKQPDSTGADNSRGKIYIHPNKRAERGKGRPPGLSPKKKSSSSLELHTAAGHYGP